MTSALNAFRVGFGFTLTMLIDCLAKIPIDQENVPARNDDSRMKIYSGRCCQEPERDREGVNLLSDVMLYVKQLQDLLEEMSVCRFRLSLRYDFDGIASDTEI